MKEMEKTKKRKERGITLIALVITIIVLLILAGVSIAMLTGENGILTQATNAKEKTQEAEDKEKIQIAINEAQISNNGYQKLTEENLQKEIDEQFGSGIVRVYPNEKNAFSFLFQNKESNYRLEKDGKLNKIDITLKINNVEEFRNFMNEVNSGNTFQDQYVYLLENIDLENQEWDVIGSYTDDTTNNAFSGIFEGNNRTINGLNINKNQDNVGLFAYNTGIIRDIILESGSITGQARVAGISSVNAGLIENCHNRGINIIFTGNTVGGGGICARSTGEITYCSNEVDIISQTVSYVAGIVSALNYSELSNCYNTGNIQAIADVGGVIASTSAESTVVGCYNAGNIVGTGEDSEGGTYVGGISGRNRGRIFACYNTGNVRSEYQNGGGICGMSQSAQIDSCYNIGVVEEQGISIGNISGTSYSQTQISNCYFSKKICDLNGVGDSYGTGTIEVFDKTINYMKTNDFVNDLNKDEDVFTINSNLNDGYPVLKWQCE